MQGKGLVLWHPVVRVRLIEEGPGVVSKQFNGGSSSGQVLVQFLDLRGVQGVGADHSAQDEGAEDCEGSCLEELDTSCPVSGVLMRFRNARMAICRWRG